MITLPLLCVIILYGNTIVMLCLNAVWFHNGYGVSLYCMVILLLWCVVILYVNTINMVCHNAVC